MNCSICCPQISIRGTTWAKESTAVSQAPMESNQGWKKWGRNGTVSKCSAPRILPHPPNSDTHASLPKFLYLRNQRGTETHQGTVSKTGWTEQQHHFRYRLYSTSRWETRSSQETAGYQLLLLHLALGCHSSPAEILTFSLVQLGGLCNRFSSHLFGTGLSQVRATAQSSCQRTPTLRKARWEKPLHTLKPPLKSHRLESPHGHRQPGKRHVQGLRRRPHTRREDARSLTTRGIVPQAGET